MTDHTRVGEEFRQSALNVVEEFDAIGEHGAPEEIKSPPLPRQLPSFKDLAMPAWPPGRWRDFQSSFRKIEETISRVEESLAQTEKCTGAFAAAATTASCQESSLPSPEKICDEIQLALLELLAIDRQLEALEYSFKPHEKGEHRRLLQQTTRVASLHCRAERLFQEALREDTETGGFSRTSTTGSGDLETAETVEIAKTPVSAFSIWRTVIRCGSSAVGRLLSSVGREGGRGREGAGGSQRGRNRDDVIRQDPRRGSDPRLRDHRWSSISMQQPGGAGGASRDQQRGGVGGAPVYRQSVSSLSRRVSGEEQMGIQREVQAQRANAPLPGSGTSTRQPTGGNRWRSDMDQIRDPF